MIDIFMLVMIIVLAVILLIANIYLLAYYCHPDDQGFGAGLTCKFVVVIGMTLSWAQVLMLPLDVSNARGGEDSFRMDIFWQVVYISLGAFVLVIIPACSAYYEADPEWSTWEKIKFSFCYLFFSIVITCAILVVSYAFLATAEIPITRVNCSILNLQHSKEEVVKLSNCISQDGYLNVDVSFPIYTIGLLSFVSWFLFVIFGGIGLPALPLDFIYEFCTRPKKMSPREVELMKKKLADDALQMKELAGEVKKMEDAGALKRSFLSKEKREYNTKFKQLKAGVVMLDQQYELFQIQSDLDNSGVLGLYLKLILGIITFIISLAWIIHVMLYIIIKPNGLPVYGFLNNWLVFLTENNVAFLSTAFFALFCLYLLWATIKGNFKFGLRIFIFGAVHPMKKNETYMNSFLFNISLILIASVSVTQFCAKAFQDYASMTEIDLIFSTQIKYLKFFSFFFRYNVFEYSFFAIAILSTIYLLCRPSDAQSVKAIFEKKQRERQSLTIHENSIN